MTNRNAYPGLRVFAALAIAVGATAILSAEQEASPKTAASVSVEKEAGNPYEGEDLLVYAPLPLTAEEAITHYVGMDQVRTGVADQEALVEDLVGDYEEQTGFSADDTFPGNDHGTQWISIEE